MQVLTIIDIIIYFAFGIFLTLFVAQKYFKAQDKHNADKQQHHPNKLTKRAVLLAFMFGLIIALGRFGFSYMLRSNALDTLKKEMDKIGEDITINTD